MGATKVLREPDRFIDTFGITRFEYLMASELMDSVGKVRIRSGVIEAQKPQIIRPDAYQNVEYDGFSPGAQKEAEKYFAWLKQNGKDIAFLQYGFEFKNLDSKEETVELPIDAVTQKLLEEARQKGDPSLAVLEGVDDTWEVSLLSFTVQMIQRSGRVNISDFKRNGLL